MEWIKLKCDLLQNEKVRLLRSEKEGDTLALLWVGLLCLAGSLNGNGVLKIHGKALTDKMLAKLLGTTPRLMHRALEAFLDYGMVSEENGVFFLPDWSSHQTLVVTEDAREKERDRKRLYRERLKSGSVPSPSRPCPEAKDKEKEKEKEKDAPPVVPPGDGSASSPGEEDLSFSVFWEAYPRKEGREAARKEWLRLAPGEGQRSLIVAAVRDRSITEEWRRENGRYVPMPARFLSERRWEDGRSSLPELERSYELDAAFERAVARGRNKNRALDKTNGVSL